MTAPHWRRWLPPWTGRAEHLHEHEHAHHLHDHAHIIERMLMTAQDDIDAITAELGTVASTVTAEFAALEEQISSGTTPDLTGLRAAVASLEALAPVPTPPAEPPAPA